MNLTWSLQTQNCVTRKKAGERNRLDLIDWEILSMTYLYFQKHSGFTVIITIVFSSYRKKEKKIYVEYKCNLYVRFLLLTSYLPLHIVDIAVAMLAGHHYSLFKST